MLPSPQGPRLVPPTAGVHASFLGAVEEFLAEGRGSAADESVLGRGIRAYHPAWREAEVFDAYVAATLADVREETPRPPGFVPSTELWYVDGGDVFLGRLSIRHRLTPGLLEWGGLIGYDVRPSARRCGHATAMLRAALPVAGELGLPSVLVTCDHGNVASRKVIEACGGVFEDRRAEKLRYWIAARPIPAGARNLGTGQWPAAGPTGTTRD